MSAIFLKTYSEITDWLDRYKIEDYSLAPDSVYGYTVRVEGNVYLDSEDLEVIPVKFSVIDYNFDCSNNKLTSLEFCPTKVYGDFDCSHNQLNALDFCPQTVYGIFYCHNNAALGNAQELIDFYKILKVHKNIVDIKNDKNILEHSLLIEKDKYDEKYNSQALVKSFKI